MDIVLQGMDGVICYLDDILVSGKTKAEHLENLRKVLQKLKQHGIRVKKSKCSFMKRMGLAPLKSPIFHVISLK